MVEHAKALEFHNAKNVAKIRFAGGKESFTRRRKEEDRSKHRRLVGHAIGDALNTVLDQVLAEIDEEEEPFVH